MTVITGESHVDVVGKTNKTTELAMFLFSAKFMAHPTRVSK